MADKTRSGTRADLLFYPSAGAATLLVGVEVGDFDDIVS